MHRGSRGGGDVSEWLLLNVSQLYQKQLRPLGGICTVKSRDCVHQSMQKVLPGVEDEECDPQSHCRNDVPI